MKWKNRKIAKGTEQEKFRVRHEYKIIIWYSVEQICFDVCDLCAAVAGMCFVFTYKYIIYYIS